jgi:hypothetical protein
LGDSVALLGTGEHLKHGRNYLDATVYNIEHQGMVNFDRNFLQWGVKGEFDDTRDNLTEWNMVDSAGYSLPYTDSVVRVNYYQRAKNHIRSYRASVFLQDAYSFALDSADMSLTAGLRAIYWEFNNELIFSPRVSLSYKPNWEKDFLFKFSTGYYYQPPFYKEMRTPEGKINKDIKAQNQFILYWVPITTLQHGPAF